MKIDNMTAEDSQLVIQGLLKQLREIQQVVDVKTRQARDLNYDVSKMEGELGNTEQALRKVLRPLIEERAALFLIHEDEVVRRISKELLNNHYDGPEKGEVMMKSTLQGYARNR